MVFRHQPVFEFQEQHNLTGLDGGWKYPSGFEAIENAISDNLLGQLRTLAEYNLKKLQGRVADGVSVFEYIDTLHNERANRIFDELLELNPSMVQIKIDRQNTKQVEDALRGVASGFNIDDINYYIHEFHGKEHGRKQSNATRRILEEKILSVLEPDSKGVGWIASLPTLEKIWEQVKDRTPVVTGEVAYSAR